MMHDRPMYTDSGDYTWTGIDPQDALDGIRAVRPHPAYTSHLGIDPQDTLDGNGPQPVYTTEYNAEARAYTIRGERITCTTVARPDSVPYDVRTLPERMQADIAAMRAEIATMRAEIACAREDHRLWRNEMSGWTTIVLDLATITNGIVERINSAPVTTYYPEAQPCP